LASLFAFDLDGTLTEHTAQLGAMMRSLRAGGACVVVISGHNTKVTPQVWRDKARQLKKLGLADAYDLLVAVDGPEEAVAQRKANYLQSVGCQVLIDNSMRNARFLEDSSVVALVPWRVRSNY
jgi:hypothetical protein